MVKYKHDGIVTKEENTMTYRNGGIRGETLWNTSTVECRNCEIQVWWNANMLG